MHTDSPHLWFFLDSELGQINVQTELTVLCYFLHIDSPQVLLGRNNVQKENNAVIILLHIDSPHMPLKLLSSGANQCAISIYSCSQKVFGWNSKWSAFGIFLLKLKCYWKKKEKKVCEDESKFSNFQHFFIKLFSCISHFGIFEDNS